MIKASCILRRYSTTRRQLPFRIHPEIQDAINASKPVLALESTVYSHGLPYPHNRELAKELNNIIYENGAIPATIGVVNGTLTVGLDDKELDLLTQTKVQKVSRRDLPVILAKGGNGGTTVAATMIAAQKAGIKVFATGGIGGVHRGGEDTMDISADLIELGRTRVAVVCSGAKSILDIGRTLEYLETQGVPVISFGQKQFPAFYTPDSGFESPESVDTHEEAARIIHSRDELGLDCGILFGVPIPASHSQDGQTIQNAINTALSELETQSDQISGNDVTPWLLARVKALSQGTSMKANLALLKNNALTASKIACSLSKLSTTNSDITRTKKNAKTSLLSFGCGAIDISAIPDSETPEKTTTRGTVRMSLGGVARNITEASHRLGVKSVLVSIVPKSPDDLSTIFHSKLKAIGMRLDGLVEFDDPTKGTLCASLLLDKNGGLIGGIADMSHAEKYITPEIVTQRINEFNPEYVVVDGNVSIEAMKTIIELTTRKGIATLFEPTSNEHSRKLFRSIGALERDGKDMCANRPLITHVTPNLYELTPMASEYELIRNQSKPKWLEKLFQDFEKADKERFKLDIMGHEGFSQISSHIDQICNLIPVVGTIWIKLGSNGLIVINNSKYSRSLNFDNICPSCTLCDFEGNALFQASYHSTKPLKNEEITSVVGAGDTMAGAIIAGLDKFGIKDANFKDAQRLKNIADFSQRAAALTIMDSNTVGPLEKLDW